MSRQSALPPAVDIPVLLSSHKRMPFLQRSGMRCAKRYRMPALTYQQTQRYPKLMIN
ncbi:hypothetical protein D1872_282000 [compost metagenome]